MTQLEKALARLQQRPTDFTWDEAVRIMQGCGFKLIKSSGSRRKFFHKDKERRSQHSPAALRQHT
jgi:predicted RNA binding protein YcfA (HicA-like mRNA interferase family)